MWVGMLMQVIDLPIKPNAYELDKGKLKWLVFVFRFVHS